jgi:lipoyl(octanoyl) transferase
LADIEWKISTEPVDYLEAIEFMEKRVEDIITGNAPEMVWLLEHPSIYTAGTSAKKKALLDPDRFPVYETGRGGEYTYHGPGQQIAYVMLNLKKRMDKPDLRKYVKDLEQWIINTLQQFDIKGERRENRIGIWVQNEDGSEDKIAALGVRVRKWVTYHGISINVTPDLSHFTGIIPCGISQHGITSIEKFSNNNYIVVDIKSALRENWTL